MVEETEEADAMWSDTHSSGLVYSGGTMNCILF